MLLRPACNSPKAPIWAAKSLRFASQRLRRAVAAGRQRDGSGSAETTYDNTVTSKFGPDDGCDGDGDGCGWVANQDE